MKIKRVIEIEESDYELSCQRYGDARYNGHQPDYENTAIAQSKPYNPSGDAISREALKEALKSNCKPELCHDYNTAWCESCCPHNDFEDLIDNAPTVDLWQMRQEATENALKKAEVLYGRPKGEWTVTKLQHGEDVTCPFCNARPTKSEYGYYLRDNFCHECGADMRKGSAENV